ncbi:MAG TPA: DsbA family oxidoreductase [Polyangiaceae bacterium]|jgi:predicted DsbA family dithiol-disulfide isomerase|nr:DsbA family oxidoreductase [Polyangiaceae bacterium]
MAHLHVDVWSDIACPWCYVGKRRLEAALKQFPERDSVHVRWHSFELNPGAPRRSEAGGNYADRLAKKYGMTVREAEARIQHLTDLARADGIPMDFQRIQPGNTFDAHRVVHLAAAQGRQDEMKERFLRGYLCEGEAIGEPEVLVRLASEIGLDEEQVRAALSSDSFAREVRADEAQAREIGIQGVPFFVLGGRYAVSGAQPVELLLRALQQTQQELAHKPEEFAEGAACGPDGC